MIKIFYKLRFMVVISFSFFLILMIMSYQISSLSEIFKANSYLQQACNIFLR